MEINKGRRALFQWPAPQAGGHPPDDDGPPPRQVGTLLMMMARPPGRQADIPGRFQGWYFLQLTFPVTISYSMMPKLHTSVAGVNDPSIASGAV